MSAFLSGCVKETGIGTIGITVVNDNGIPIQNCSIVLEAPVDGSYQLYGHTDINGYIEFKSKLHVFYDVVVWKGLWLGCDFVEIKPGESRTKNVIIYSPGTELNGCI